MARDMDERIKDAQEELRDWAKENPADDEPHDQISEIADTSVPIDYSGIFSAAAEDSDLALTEPDIGPAFDGTPTPVNIIAANIYEKIEAALWEEWARIEEEREEAEEVEAEKEPAQ